MSWNCHALLGFVRFLKCTFQFSFLTLEKEIRLGFNASLSLVLYFFLNLNRIELGRPGGNPLMAV